MLFEHLIIGMIAVALGVVGVKYNYQLVGITGNIGFVEQYLGYGSTYSFLKIMSVLLSIGGFIYMFGLMDPLLAWMLSPLTVFFHQPKAS